MGNCNRKEFVDDETGNNQDQTETASSDNLIRQPYLFQRDLEIIDPLCAIIKNIVPKEYLLTDVSRFSKFYRVKKNAKCENNVLYQVKLLEKKSTCQLFNAKIITRDKIKQMGEELFKALFTAELNALSLIKHPNVEKIIKVFVLSYKISFKVILVTDYCTNTSLLDIINEHITNQERFTYEDITAILKILILALYAFKAKKIVNRNISPDNIFLIQNNNYNTLSIRNLYFSKSLEKTQTSTGVFGGLWYMSPEMLRDLKYDYKVDLWSIGVILYMMVALENPFINCKSQDSVLNTLKLKTCFKSDQELKLLGVNPVILQFMRKILNENPSARTSIELLFEDELIKNKSHVTLKLGKTRILNFIDYKGSFYQEFKLKLTKKKTGELFHQLAFYIIFNCKDLFLKQEELADLNQFYYLFDKNNDGAVTYNEIQKILDEVLKNNEDKVKISTYVDLIRLILDNPFVTDFLKLKTREIISYDMFIASNLILKLIKHKNDMYPNGFVDILFEEIDIHNNKLIEFNELQLFLKRKKNTITKDLNEILNYLILNSNWKKQNDETQFKKLLCYELIQLDKTDINYIEKIKIDELEKEEKKKMNEALEEFNTKSKKAKKRNSIEVFQQKKRKMSGFLQI